MGQILPKTVLVLKIRDLQLNSFFCCFEVFSPEIDKNLLLSSKVISQKVAENYTESYFFSMSLKGSKF